MIVAPSLLSADFNNLGRDIEMINESEAGMFHMDVMDGVFVPNISFGFPVIKAVSRLARKPLDVHLMIVEPQRYISQVRDCGAAIMNIHQEACIHQHRTVAAIHDAGMKAAVTLNPSTPVETLRDIVGDLDGVVAEFDRVVGLARLKAVHVNDSMNALGAHKDRHEKIGEGYLGKETFARIVRHPKLLGKPMILETPNELDGYTREIALLRAYYNYFI